MLLPSWQALAVDSSAAACRGGCQFARIRLSHLLLHLLLCTMRQPFSLLHALGCPRRTAGSAEWLIALLPPACSGGRRYADMTADSHSHPRLCCLVAAAVLRRRSSAGSDKSMVGRRLGQTREVSVYIRNVIYEINENQEPKCCRTSVNI